MAIVALWQESDISLVVVQGLPRLGLRVLFGLATTGIFWGTFALGTFDVFGLKSIWHLLGGKPPESGPFVIRGPYRWVRHPLYLFLIVMIWSCPDLSLDRLVFNTLWTIWILVGTILEERDLVVAFGDDYRDYQKSTPMLIPRGIRPVVDEYIGNR